MSQGWTDERVDLLKKLWGEGLSASQIAAQLGGVTRNAVIGKVHRLGLSGRSRSNSQPSSSRPKRSSRPSQSAARTTRSAQKQENSVTTSAASSRTLISDLPEPVPMMISLLELTETTCKFPIGDPQTEAFGFCGNNARNGDRYCEYHCRLTYQPAADRRRERATADRTG